MFGLTALIIAGASIIGLMVIHELGHFTMALIFKMPIEEFGLGLPPRLIAHKIKSVVVSLNLLPFGAFVRIKGEEDGEKKEGFNTFPAWQRALVLVAGVVGNWLTAVVLFAIVAGSWGLPYAVADDAVAPQAQLQVITVAPDSPAEEAGLKSGDWIVSVGVNEEMTAVHHLSEFTAFIDLHQGKAVELQLNKPEGLVLVSLIPRESPPAGEGAIGISFARVDVQHYAWWQAPKVGLIAAVNQTIAIPLSLGSVFSKWIHHQPTPGASLVGPIGIGQMIMQTSQLGWRYLLQFVAIIAIYFSLFNILPLPALDGGRLIFLAVEGVRRKTVSPKIKEWLNGTFLILFMILLALVTIKDIIHLF